MHAFIVVSANLMVRTAKFNGNCRLYFQFSISRRKFILLQNKLRVSGADIDEIQFIFIHYGLEWCECVCACSLAGVIFCFHFWQPLVAMLVLANVGYYALHCIQQSTVHWANNRMNETIYLLFFEVNLCRFRLDRNRSYIREPKDWNGSLVRWMMMVFMKYNRPNCISSCYCEWTLHKSVRPRNTCRANDAAVNLQLYMRQSSETTKYSEMKNARLQNNWQRLCIPFWLSKCGRCTENCQTNSFITHPFLWQRNSTLSNQKPAPMHQMLLALVVHLSILSSLDLVWTINKMRQPNLSEQLLGEQWTVNTERRSPITTFLWATSCVLIYLQSLSFPKFMQLNVFYRFFNFGTRPPERPTNRPGGWPVDI